MARILLADDDAAARDLVERALAADGHAVTCTQDGSEALERLGSAAPAFDLMIADVAMPAMDGIAVAEEAVAQQPRLKVILVSGFADALGRAQHLRPRIAGVVAKPITLEGIRAAVRAALG